MSVTNKRRGPSDLAPLMAVLGISCAAGLVFGLWGAMIAGAKLDHRPAPPHNPFAAVLELAGGKYRWPGPDTTTIVVVAAVLITTLIGAVWRLTARLRQPRRHVDAAAAHLATDRELAALTYQGARRTAARLGVDPNYPGVLVGVSRLSGNPLFASWEDMHVDIWGPRTGKTTSRAIPAICGAPGAVLATSNKRDLLDATRGVREKIDKDEVWVFDPQAIANEPCTWWVQPLDYVTDVATATKLAAVFAGFSKVADAKTDAFFDTRGEALLSNLLLAAAMAGRTIRDAYRWTLDPTNREPASLLREAGYDLVADAVEDDMNAPDKQRGGVFATASKALDFAKDDQIAAWVCPDPNAPNRRRFDAHAFARSRGTLYMLSRESEGTTAGALVTALTIAVVEAAEQLATRSPGGRLTNPMLGCLDEAANVCRWKQLPNLYSHYGSRGIVLMTILQSWSQGVEVWGEGGMKKLWSAANIRVYGGGVSEIGFLTDLTKLVGEWEPETSTVSTQRGSMASTSVSRATRSEQLLTEADLAAMPRGRALLFPSGARPVLIETQPWTTGPHAEQVRASLRRYSPEPDLEPAAPTMRAVVTP